MSRMLKFTLLIILTVFGVSSYAYAESSEIEAGQDARPLTLGLLPHLNSRKLLKVYDPLVKYLRQTLKRRLVVSTAPDFDSYYKRSSQGAYDFYLTAPHFAAYAEIHYKARRVSKFSRPLYSVIVVNKKSKYQTIGELKGGIVATPDNLSVTAIIAELTFLENGLVPNKDVTIKYSGTHGNAMIQTAKNVVDAAVVGVSAFEIMDKKFTKNLRILAKNRVIPHMMFMAKSDLSNKEYEDIKKAMLSFNAKGAGKKFFSDSVFGDMTSITTGDMQRLSPLLPVLADRI